MMKDKISTLIFSYFTVDGQKTALETCKPSNRAISRCKDVRIRPNTNNIIHFSRGGQIWFLFFFF